MNPQYLQEIKLVNPGADSWAFSYTGQSASAQVANVPAGGSMTIFIETSFNCINNGTMQTVTPADYYDSEGRTYESITVVRDHGYFLTLEELPEMHGAWLICGLIVGLYLVDQVANIMLPVGRRN
jgi:hypothetical protein